MKIIKQNYSPNRFYTELKRPVKKVLFLDYDGTLAPFRKDRERATPYAGVVPVLESIKKNPSTRLVIVTGREAYKIRELLQLSEFPEIWGSHGFERLLPDDTYTFMEPKNSPNLTALLEIDKTLQEIDKRIGVEKKPASRAFHWRGYSEAVVDNMRESLYASISPQLENSGLLIKEFDGGLEVSIPGRNKGDAVRAVLNEMPKDTISAYLGDDKTDEYAFKELNMHANTLSILVRKELRDTSAMAWITPPDELLRFLENWDNTAG